VLKRLLALTIVGMLLFAACGGDDSDSEAAPDLPACESDLPADASVTGVPSDFPKPDKTIFSAAEQAGPSTIVDGYYDGDLGDSFDAWKSTFEDAGWDITKDEQEEKDAEVFFAKGDTNGQVNMFAECDGRTKLRITIRPS
jgi:hypothetical protein